MRQAFIGFLSTVLLAATAGAAEKRLTRSCEEALALSAIPASLRDGATVYVLGPNGYEKTMDGDGPFTCVVARNHPLSLVPQCVSRTGADEIIPAILYTSRRALEGAQGTAVREEFENKAANGEFVPPKAAGANYMMSAYNYIYVAPAGRIVHVPAHVMFFAPNLSADDVGGATQQTALANKGQPFLFEQGIHGYMVSFVEQAADASSVKQACAGQVGDEPPTLEE